MSEKDKPSISTGGGAYIGGSVSVTGGKFVGRDDLSGQPVTIEDFTRPTRHGEPKAKSRSPR